MLIKENIYYRYARFLKMIYLSGLALQLMMMASCADSSFPGINNKKAQLPSSQHQPDSASFVQPDVSHHFSLLNPDEQTLGQRFPIRTARHSQVAVLNETEDFFKARDWILTQAKQEVLLQYYLWKGDESGWYFARKLIALNNQGVRVRIIVDPLANLSFASQNLLSFMVANNIEVIGFQPFYQNVLSKLKEDPNDFLSEGNYRYHDKIMIVDPHAGMNAYAIVGGANIGNEYFSIDKEDPKQNWRDKDVLLRGEIVQDIAKVWSDNYRELSQELGTPNQNQFSAWLQSFLMKDPTVRAQQQQNIQRLTSASIQLNWQPAVMRFMQSRPQKKEDYIFQAYLSLINEAKSEIIISNSYFIPSLELQTALKNAALRGVKIKILTNSDQASDFPIIAKAARTLYKDLLVINSQMGQEQIELYEWGGHALKNNGTGLHHAKFAIFDQTAAIVGSYNLDPRSRHFNSETVVVFENPLAIRSLVQSFQQDIQLQFSSKITHQQAQSFVDDGGLLKVLENTFYEQIIPLL